MNFKEEKNITIFEHPLIKHKISLPVYYTHLRGHET